MNLERIENEPPVPNQSSVNPTSFDVIRVGQCLSFIANRHLLYLRRCNRNKKFPNRYLLKLEKTEFPSRLIVRITRPEFGYIFASEFLCNGIILQTAHSSTGRTGLSTDHFSTALIRVYLSTLCALSVGNFNLISLFAVAEKTSQDNAVRYVE